VQVVERGDGASRRVISGLREAHAIALDDTGQFGYISDGPAGHVKVFDRRTLAVVATILTGPAPRALVYEPQNRLLFAVCANPLEERPSQPAGNQGRTPPTHPAAHLRPTRPQERRPTSRSSLRLR